MQSHDLKALSELQTWPVLIGPGGQAVISELGTWAGTEERMEYRRHRHEAIAHAGMSLEELHLFFARAGHTAAKSWNDNQSGWGKVKNLLTTSHVGFAQVPGRILKQALKSMEEDPEELISPTVTYLMRADAALDFRDRLKMLLEVSV